MNLQKTALKIRPLFCDLSVEQAGRIALAAIEFAAFGAQASFDDEAENTAWKEIHSLLEAKLERDRRTSLNRSYARRRPDFASGLMRPVKRDEYDPEAYRKQRRFVVEGIRALEKKREEERADSVFRAAISGDRE